MDLFSSCTSAGSWAGACGVWTCWGPSAGLGWFPASAAAWAAARERGGLLPISLAFSPVENSRHAFSFTIFCYRFLVDSFPPSFSLDISLGMQSMIFDLRYTEHQPNLDEKERTSTRLSHKPAITALLSGTHFRTCSERIYYKSVTGSMSTFGRCRSSLTWRKIAQSYIYAISEWVRVSG